MRKIFSDEYTSEDVATLQTIVFIAVILFGTMVFISSEMGIFLC